MTKTLTGYDDLCQVLKQCHLCIKNNITEQMTINDSCHKHKHLHFAFMHLADAFIQSDLQSIQVVHICQYVCSLGI